MSAGGGTRLIGGGGGGGATAGRLAGLKKLCGCSASPRAWNPSAIRDARRASSGFSGRGSTGGGAGRAIARRSSGLTGRRSRGLTGRCSMAGRGASLPQDRRSGGCTGLTGRIGSGCGTGVGRRCSGTAGVSGCSSGVSSLVRDPWRARSSKARQRGPGSAGRPQPVSVPSTARPPCAESSISIMTWSPAEQATDLDPIRATPGTPIRRVFLIALRDKHRASAPARSSAVASGRGAQEGAKSTTGRPPMPGGGPDPAPGSPRESDVTEIPMSQRSRTKRLAARGFPGQQMRCQRVRKRLRYVHVNGRLSSARGAGPARTPGPPGTR